MSKPAAPRHSSMSLARSTGLVAILILALIGLVHCGSTEKPNTTEPAGTTSPTAEPRVADEPVTLTPAPVSEPAPAPEPVPLPEPAPVPETAPLPDYSDDSSDSSSGSVYYKNCSAARAAGVTPLHAGEPGYASHLDRDGDGVACE